MTSISVIYLAIINDIENNILSERYLVIVGQQCASPLSYRSQCIAAADAGADFEHVACGEIIADRKYSNYIMLKKFHHLRALINLHRNDIWKPA